MANKIHQFGPNNDKNLNSLSVSIGDAEARIEKADQDKDTAWEQVFSIFDELPSAGDRFLASDGHTLTRQKRAGSVKLNKEMLQALIFQNYERPEATRIWNSITIRTVDSTALEAAKRTGKITADIIDQCMTISPDTFARIRPEWTKEDKERVRILGIERQ